jgi:hypothetical protein
LHLTDGLTTLAYDHTNCFIRNEDRVVDLVKATVVSRVATALLWGVGGVGASAVTIDNLHDEVLGLSSRSIRPNKVDRAKTVDALGLADDVDVAATSLLQVTDGLATPPDDKAHGTVGNHDLQAVFSILEVYNRRDNALRGRTATAVQASPGNSAHTTVVDNPVDGSLGFRSSSARARDLALPELLVAGAGGQELDPALRLSLDTAQVLTLSAYDEAHETRLDLHGFGGIVVIASKRRALSCRVGSSRGECTAAALATTRTRRVGSIASVAARGAVVTASLISIRVVIFVESFATVSGRSGPRVAMSIASAEGLEPLVRSEVVGGGDSLSLGYGILETHGAG